MRNLVGGPRLAQARGESGGDAEPSVGGRKPVRMRIVVGISGASGVLYGVRLLKALRVEKHLILSEEAGRIAEVELGIDADYIHKLADESYDNSDLFAPISSGSVKFDAMVIAPCSTSTMSKIACGIADNLMTRVAAVALKERRKLILVARETPLSYIHIKNMETASKAGAILLPPVLSLYSKPKTIDDMVNHIVGKALDVLGFENSLYKRWK